MPANVDTMFWLESDGAPWHGKGMMLKESPKSGREAIVQAGLDWSVAAFPTFELVPGEADLGDVSTQPFSFDHHERVEDDEGTEGAEEIDTTTYEGKLLLSDRQVIYRTDNWTRLGNVGSNYETLQNEDAFTFFDDALGTGKVVYRVAGSLRGGRIVWILASLPDSLVIGKDDEVAKFLLLATSHDGSMAVWILVTPIRVVCENTLTGALGDVREGQGGRHVNRIWHTQGVRQRLVDYSKVLAHVEDVYRRTGEAFSVLADHKLEVADVDDFMNEMFPLPPTRPQQMEGIRERVIDLFEGSAMGADLGAARGTSWGLYNAVAEWTDHERGRDHSRLHQAWMGDGAKLKERALWHLLKLAE